MKPRKKRRVGSGSSTDPEPSLGDSNAKEVEDQAKLDEDELALIERHEAQVALVQAPPSRLLERGVGLALVGLSALGIYVSQTIVIRNQVNSMFGPRWWPTALCLISLALSIALTIAAFTRLPFERVGVENSSRAGWYRVAVTLIAEVLFIVAWSVTGNFVVPGVLMLAVMLWFYGTRKWTMLVAFPILSIAFIYALFSLLLKIPL